LRLRGELTGSRWLERYGLLGGRFAPAALTDRNGSPADHPPTDDRSAWRADSIRECSAPGALRRSNTRRGRNLAADAAVTQRFRGTGRRRPGIRPRSTEARCVTPRSHNVSAEGVAAAGWIGMIRMVGSAQPRTSTAGSAQPRTGTAGSAQPRTSTAGSAQPRTTKPKEDFSYGRHACIDPRTSAVPGAGAGRASSRTARLTLGVWAASSATCGSPTTAGNGSGSFARRSR